MAKLPPIHIDPSTFLTEHCTLPVLPVVVTNLQEVIYSDNVSVRKVADLISSDPSMTAQVLKIVNSAYYSLPREIADVKLAVAYLGINEVYRITLSVAVLNTFASVEKEDFNRIWSHSVFTALAAKQLTQKYEPLLPNGELWAAAILHDIGKFIYLKFFPEHFKAIETHQLDHGCLYNEAEEALSLPSAAMMGALLCDKWRLPEQVKSACMHHSLNDLYQIEGNSLSESFKRMICVSNMITTLHRNKLKKEIKEKIAEAVQDALNCTESDLLALLSSIYDLESEVEKMAFH